MSCVKLKAQTTSRWRVDCSESNFRYDTEILRDSRTPKLLAAPHDCAAWVGVQHFTGAAARSGRTMESMARADLSCRLCDRRKLIVVLTRCAHEEVDDSIAQGCLPQLPGRELGRLDAREPSLVPRAKPSVRLRATGGDVDAVLLVFVQERHEALVRRLAVRGED
eukprot:3450395-Prymnesium_polylepis.1